jgi:glycosyltransferase involved in cell wall biosynthesis
MTPGTPRRTLDILQVITDGDRRGAQVFATELGGALTALGHRVRTVALAPGHTGLLDVEVLGRRRRGLRALRRLRRAMATVDVTVAHGSATLLACSIAGLGPGRPFVYRQISDPLFWAGDTWRRARVRLLYRAPARVVALSPTTSRVLVERFGVSAQIISVIPNAVDEHRFRAASETGRRSARLSLGVLPDAPVVAYVGALTEEKGVADLFAAAEGTGWQLLVAGTGPLEVVLRERYGDPSSATFVGPVLRPQAIYEAADVVVLPSRSDMHPAVILEAGLVGRPVVTTTVGAIPDLVEDGVTGHLVEAGNVPALRRAIDELLGGSQRDAMGAAARHRVLVRFSLTGAARSWEDVLTQVAGRRIAR